MPLSDASIDLYVVASARLLGLRIEPRWHTSVMSHLAIILGNAELVAGFVLPEDTDPAPEFDVTAFEVGGDDR